MNRNTLRAPLVPGVLVTGFALLLTLWSPNLAQAATMTTPAALVVKSTTTATASLDWSKVTGASGYRVRYATSSTMVDARSAAFRYSFGSITGLQPGTKYWFRIAVAANGGTGAAQSAYTRAPYPTGTTAAPAPPTSSGSYDLHVAAFNISGILNDTSRNQPWSVRRSKVAQQLLGQNPSDEPGAAPDVIALQEANTTRKLNSAGLTQYTDLVATLNLYATGTDHYSPIDPTIQSMSTRIAYNDHTLTLVRGGAVKWDAQETAIDGLRYMPWGIFQVRSTGARFFFASDHLESASESVRRQQWYQLIRDVPVMAGGLPVILGGDFNSPRGSVSGTLINPTASVMLPKMKPAGFGDTLGAQGRGLYYISQSRPGAKNVVKGNFNSLNRFDPVLHPYTNTDILGQDIDYIFASNSLQVKKWEMVIDEATTGPNEFTLQGLIPSDHNMIRSTIVLPAPKP
ncbi:MAG: endonuclease/exonuclease/phosphatase family protein [Marmoricola sp.]